MTQEATTLTRERVDSSVDYLFDHGMDIVSYLVNLDPYYFRGSSLDPGESFMADDGSGILSTSIPDRQGQSNRAGLILEICEGKFQDKHKTKTGYVLRGRYGRWNLDPSSISLFLKIIDAAWNVVKAGNGNQSIPKIFPIHARLPWKIDSSKILEGEFSAAKGISQCIQREINELKYAPSHTLTINIRISFSLGNILEKSGPMGFGGRGTKSLVSSELYSFVVNENWQGFTLKMESLLKDFQANRENIIRNYYTEL